MTLRSEGNSPFERPLVSGGYPLDREEKRAIGSVLDDPLEGAYFNGRDSGWHRCREALLRKLIEMELHDGTGDPHDEGWMDAVTELRVWLKRAALPGGQS